MVIEAWTERSHERPVMGEGPDDEKGKFFTFKVSKILTEGSDEIIIEDSLKSVL